MHSLKNINLRLPVILLLVASFFVIGKESLRAQSTLGVTGLLNSPNAVMSKEGTVKIGGNFLNTNMTPNTWDYNTFNFFLNVTLFSFFEAALTNTAFDLYDEGRFSNVDRSVSLKLRFLKESKYFPAIAIGSNDVLTSNTNSYFSPDRGNKYFGTHYVAISKHFNIKGHTLGLHSAYNILSSEHQTINFPISGGISFSPSFYNKLNLIAEYDTRNFNLGGNALVFKYLFLQVFIQDFKYLSFGAHAQIPLL